MQSKLLSKLRLGDFCSVLVSFWQGCWEEDVRIDFLLGKRAWLLVTNMVVFL